MKLTLRVNGSESVIIQKIDAIYTKEEINKEDDSLRNVEVLTKQGYTFFLLFSIYEMQNAFTYLLYDNEPYVLRTEWVKIKDKDGNLIKHLKKD